MLEFYLQLEVVICSPVLEHFYDHLKKTDLTDIYSNLEKKTTFECNLFICHAYKMLKNIYSKKFNLLGI